MGKIASGRSATCSSIRRYSCINRTRTTKEFTGEGEVDGPGTGTSDSIPALLSDGEFVFTAKAVKNLGVDKLRKMMKQAEESYDAGVQSQEEEQEIV